MKVLLFKGRGFVSRAIRLQTRSKYSHAAILLDDGYTIIESWQGVNAVRKTKVKDWADIDVFRFEDGGIGLDFETKICIENWLHRQIGKKYDYRAVVRFISRVKAPSNERFFCSELVAEAFRREGLELLSRVPSSHVSPGMLAWSPRLVLEESH